MGTTKEEISRAFRQAKPIQRIALFFVVTLIVVIFSFIGISVFGAMTKGEEVDKRSSFNAPIYSPTEVNDAVITDATTPQGKIATAEAKRKAEASLKNGNSAFQPLVVNEPKQEQIINLPVQNAVRAEDEPNNTLTKIDQGMIKQLQQGEAEKEKTVSPATPESLKSSSYVGLAADQYANVLAEKTALKRQELLSAIAVMKAERSYRSPPPTVFTTTPVPVLVAGQGNSQQSSEINTAGAGINNQTQGVSLLFAPGDKIFAYTDYTVDSRIPNPIIMRVMNKQLKDARIRCEFVDQGSFLVPKCTSITFQNKVVNIDAIVLNPNTLNGIVDQDIDDDLLMKTLAKVGTGILSVAGAQKLASGEKKINTSDGTTTTSVTENTLTDREILLGATAQQLGQLNSVAEKYYAEPSVKTIPAQTQMIIVFVSPLGNFWGLDKDKVMDGGYL